MLRSSNLPFYSAIWEAAKESKGLVAFHKRFYWGEQQTRATKRTSEKRCALVDVVAHDGDEWIKVSTITEQRLLFELAKARWEVADSSSDEADYEENDGEGKKIDEESRENGIKERTESQGNVENRWEEKDADDATANGIRKGLKSLVYDDDLSRMELVRTANDLYRASVAHRIHYRYPQVRFVLPKISNPAPPELMLLFDRIRSTGAIIDPGPQASSGASMDELKTMIFPCLLPSPHPPLTDTLNIDCTILLALVSDLSHAANHPIQENYNAAIKRQIELETRQHLLPSSLWPAIANKKLVCTEEAADRMREIVDTIGTPKERARTEILLADPQTHVHPQDRDRLCDAFATYSDHSIPSTLLLPIKIVPSPNPLSITAAISTHALPQGAQHIATLMTPINRSVFLYGWLHGFTTVTSNRTVAKMIESEIEKEGRGERGPEIWLREPARSLLGREKVRKA